MSDLHGSAYAQSCVRLYLGTLNGNASFTSKLTIFIVIQVNLSCDHCAPIMCLSHDLWSPSCACHMISRHAQARRRTLMISSTPHSVSEQLWGRLLAASSVPTPPVRRAVQHSWTSKPSSPASVTRSIHVCLSVCLGSDSRRLCFWCNHIIWCTV